MSKHASSSKKSQQAASHNEEGLKRFAEWEIDDAVAAFQKAIALDPDHSEFHLNLARAHARAGRFHDAMGALGDFLRTEPDEKLSERYERLFSSAMDEVETTIIEKMRARATPVQQIGKAIQMWLEYRITLGRRPLNVPKPAVWSAAIAYATYKINMEPVRLEEVAKLFGVTERAARERYEELVNTLDLMPGDYRYFTGEENPLDKLVDAAQALDEIYNRFQEE